MRITLGHHWTTQIRKHRVRQDQFVLHLITRKSFERLVHPMHCHDQITVNVRRALDQKMKLVDRLQIRNLQEHAFAVFPDGG